MTEGHAGLLSVAGRGKRGGLSQKGDKWDYVKAETLIYSGVNYKL